MNYLKAMYISAYTTVLLAVSLFGTYVLVDAGISAAWSGIVLASVVQLAFLARLFLWPTARTSASLPVVQFLATAGALTAVVASFSAGQPALAVLATGVGIVMPLLYVYWYSSFGTRDHGQLVRGGALPAIELRDESGRVVPFQQLVESKALWMFYRGNWCPLCMAQIQEVAQQYQELARRGVRIYLISPQSPEHTADLARKFDVPMQFLIDTDNRAAGRLGILMENGLPAGLQVMGYDSDVPMPTVFITDIGGQIIYADLTENYRIRPEPQEFLAVLDRHARDGISRVR